MTTTTTNKKTTTKPTTNSTNQTAKLTILELRVKKLEDCLAKMAHMTGQERVLDEFGIERWTPSKDDMRKYKN